MLAAPSHRIRKRTLTHWRERTAPILAWLCGSNNTGSNLAVDDLGTANFRRLVNTPWTLFAPRFSQKIGGPSEGERDAAVRFRQRHHRLWCPLPATDVHDDHPFSSAAPPGGTRSLTAEASIGVVAAWGRFLRVPRGVDRIVGSVDAGGGAECEDTRHDGSPDRSGMIGADALQAFGAPWLQGAAERPSNSDGCATTTADDHSPCGQSAGDAWWRAAVAAAIVHFDLWTALRRPNERHLQAANALVLELCATSKVASPICRLIADIAAGGRDRAHEAKHLLQEAGIVALLLRMRQESDLVRRATTLVDVGGGNGLLCFVAGAIINSATCIVVDPYVPPRRVELDVARDDAHFRRVVSSITSLDFRRDVLPPSGGGGDLGHGTVILAKHLCGSAVDDLLRTCEVQNVWPDAFILATCCHFKSHSCRYVAPDYLADTMNGASMSEVGDDDDHRLLLTRPADGGTGGQSSDRPPDFMQLAKFTGWLSAQNPPWVQATARCVERVFDEGRVQWLRKRGYRATLVPFCPEFVTMRNQAIVAYRTPTLPLHRTMGGDVVTHHSGR